MEAGVGAAVHLCRTKGRGPVGGLAGLLGFILNPLGGVGNMAAQVSSGVLTDLMKAVGGDPAEFTNPPPDQQQALLGLLALAAQQQGAGGAGGAPGQDAGSGAAQAKIAQQQQQMQALDAVRSAQRAAIGLPE